MELEIFDPITVEAVSVLSVGGFLCWFWNTSSEPTAVGLKLGDTKSMGFFHLHRHRRRPWPVARKMSRHLCGKGPIYC